MQSQISDEREYPLTEEAERGGGIVCSVDDTAVDRVEKCPGYWQAGPFKVTGTVATDPPEANVVVEFGGTITAISLCSPLDTATVQPEGEPMNNLALYYTRESDFPNAMSVSVLMPDPANTPQWTVGVIDLSDPDNEL